MDIKLTIKNNQVRARAGSAGKLGINAAVKAEVSAFRKSKLDAVLAAATQPANVVVNYTKKYKSAVVAAVDSKVASMRAIITSAGDAAKNIKDVF